MSEDKRAATVEQMCVTIRVAARVDKCIGCCNAFLQPRA